MDQDSTIPTPLPVIGTIHAAFQFVWDKHARMLRALLIPAAAIFILKYFMLSTGRPSATDGTDIYNQAVYSWLYFLVYMAPYILFAITCHRLVLVSNHGVPDYGLLKWTQRETRYLGWSLVIAIIAGLASFVVKSLFLSKVVSDVDAGAGVDSSNLAWLYPYLAYVPILYIFSRLSVLYPATAVEEPASLKRAWALTLDNGWRLTLIVGLLPWIAYFLLGVLLRENATVVEIVIHKLLWLVLLAVEIVALSFSYKHLAQHETPPAPGP